MVKIYYLFSLFLAGLFGFVVAARNRKNNSYKPPVLNDTPVKVALCAIGKDENRYIREWVEYYKNFGVNKIYLYDNNDINGERFEDVIGDYVENKFVEIIDKRGVVKSTKVYNDGNTVQGLAYQECYYNNYKNYDWMFFFDIDEFLSIDYKYKNIYEFLNDFNEFDGIKVQWRMYGDNGKLYYEDKPVVERFKSKNNLRHSKTLKTIVHCKDYEKTLLFRGQGVINQELTIVNVLKKKVSGFSDLTKSRPRKNLPVYLDHFHTKSTEEYIKRKYMKTDASFGYLNEKNNSIKKIRESYFKHNKFSKDKQILFNDAVIKQRNKEIL